jgi:hypothetical protein
MELQAFLDERFGAVESRFGSGLLVDSEAFGVAQEWTENREETAATLATFVCQAASLAMAGAFPPWGRSYSARLPRGVEALLINAAGQFGLRLFQKSRLRSAFAPSELLTTPVRFVELPAPFYPPDLAHSWYRTIIRPVQQDAERCEVRGVREQATRTAKMAEVFANEKLLRDVIRNAFEAVCLSAKAEALRKSSEKHHTAGRRSRFRVVGDSKEDGCLLNVFRRWRIASD